MSVIPGGLRDRPPFRQALAGQVQAKPHSFRQKTAEFSAGGLAIAAASKAATDGEAGEDQLCLRRMAAMRPTTSPPRPRPSISGLFGSGTGVPPPEEVKPPPLDKLVEPLWLEPPIRSCPSPGPSRGCPLSRSLERVRSRQPPLLQELSGLHI